MLPFVLDQTVPQLPPRGPSYKVGSTYGFFPPVHLVYVHGFRGDHTSFQRFPTDLHYSLEDRIPSLCSHVYPTYKSRKPLQVSVDRLLAWLQTLEPGFIILIGHSLGGFVVAEAGLQHKPDPGRSQVIGVIAMDVPYLGIHPHVIISGIASLFPSEKTATQENDLNDTDKIHMVPKSDVCSEVSADSRTSSPSPSSSTGPSRSPSPSPSGRSSPGPNDMSSWKLPDLTPGPTLGQSAVHFFRKHSRDPFKAMSNWLVSHWEHGSMLLDPSDLRSRYEKLEKWNGGEWVNFYTETVPEVYARSKSRSRSRSPNLAQPASREGSIRSTRSESEKREVKIHFPEPRPYSPAQSTASEASFHTAEGVTSSFGNAPQLGQLPEIKFPEPEAASSPTEGSDPTQPEPLTVDLGSSAIPLPDEKSEHPATQQDAEAASTASTLSLITGPFMAAMNPNDSGGTRPLSQTVTANSSPDTASTNPEPGSMFPLPHPPLNDEQQKKHDKAVNKLVEQQKKAELQVAKTEEKEKKAAAKAEEKRAKEERNALMKQAKAEQKEAELAAKLQAEKEKPGIPRHFIVIPWESTPSRTHWLRVPVAGSPSEVDAHCGIFFREKNLQYDEFVERVAKWVQDLCEKKAKEALAY
ncbi:hypothetical protein FRC04_008155 [Tulasnella sp. 424]|nr:hypothetical protein FRC04_008155 [Tulasnella sp. 424]KAG8974438.1 hypothetical protein FRC05_007237 [Tulasnella sp. 425]